jgi:acid phosphatase
MSRVPPTPRLRIVGSFLAVSALAAAMVAAACAKPRPVQTGAPAVPPAPAPAPRVHENLNAVLWIQTSVEYEATARQVFRTASLKLDAALADPGWTALEQGPEAAGLPPAVIADVDETVLDNSAFQARQVRDHFPFGEAVWQAWCKEVAARAVPGAVEFARHAATRGVTVFYVTNRYVDVEAATRENMSRLGFPLQPATDQLLTRKERPEWAASDKASRRAFVAGTHRVLLLIGDDLNDFVSAAGKTVEERAQLSARHASQWGERWFMAPNPTYGSWEAALAPGATSESERLAMKQRRLRTEDRK